VPFSLQKDITLHDLDGSLSELVLIIFL